MSSIVCQSCDDLLMHDRAKGKQMAVSMVNLTPTTQQEALRQQCEALAATCAQRALDYDRAGQFPVENFADLRRHGLLGLTIPRELGGLGETYFGFALVVEEIARGCASTGLCFTMHCAGVALVPPYQSGPATAPGPHRGGRWCALDARVHRTRYGVAFSAATDHGP